MDRKRLAVVALLLLTATTDGHTIQVHDDGSTAGLDLGISHHTLRSPCAMLLSGQEQVFPCRYAKFANSDQTTTNITARILLTSPRDGCSDYGNLDDTPKIAVAHRGGCDFGTKVLKASKAGAIGLMVIDHANTGGLVTMKTNLREAADIGLPAVSIPQNIGLKIESLVQSGKDLKMRITQKRQFKQLSAISHIEAAQNLIHIGDVNSGMKKLRAALGNPTIRSDRTLLQRVLVGLGEIENHTAKLEKVLKDTSDLVLLRAKSQEKIKETISRVFSTHKCEDPPCKKPLAIFTHVRDEEDILPHWLRFYHQQVPWEDIYVLDHDSKDGSTDSILCHVIRVENGGVHDHHFLLGNVKIAQRELLQHYHHVLFAESDEFVLAHPSKFSSLSDYIKAKDSNVACCSGWQPVQLRTEQALDWTTHPLLSQRSQWTKDILHSKPLLTNRPLNYALGFHSAEGIKSEPDEDLILVHFHRIDFNFTRKRHKAFANMKWHKLEKAAGLSNYQLIHEGEMFEKWYYNDGENNHSSLPGNGLQLEPIDEAIRNVCC